MERHERHTIATNERGRIDRCTCGTFYLVFDNLTLKLEPEGFKALVKLVSEAASVSGGGFFSPFLINKETDTH
jgi:hypothetical protein